MALAQNIMEAAIEEAMIAKQKGEVPVGAVITYSNEIIARGHNQIIQTNNSLAHAEIIAIHSAMKILNQKYLNECDLYVTLEPCCMCAGAIVLARIRRLYIGAEDSKIGAAGSLYNIVQDKNLNHYCEIYSGINEKECKKILTDFFAEIRMKNKYF
jgi:tRNA(adenine34) deaminase